MSLSGWFKRRFVFAFVVQCSTLPRLVPDGAFVRRTGSGPWKYSIYCDCPEIFDALVTSLASEKLSYAAQAHEKSGMAAEWLQAPGIGARFFWRALVSLLCCTAVFVMPSGVITAFKGLLDWREWSSGFGILLEDIREAIRI